MSREIKFKGWCAKDKKMYDWHEIGLESYGAYELRPDKPEGDIRYWDADLLLLQYIGLQDKNGRELVVGDILEDSFGQRAVVKEFVDEDHCMSGFHLVELKKNDKAGWTVFEGSWLKIAAKVIGNIWENSDLLTTPV